jgi:hypothetical protein
MESPMDLSLSSLSQMSDGTRQCHWDEKKCRGESPRANAWAPSPSQKDALEFGCYLVEITKNQIKPEALVDSEELFQNLMAVAVVYQVQPKTSSLPIEQAVASKDCCKG